MKIYIKSSLKDKHKNTLDMLVDGNKLWNPLTGEYETISEERLEEWRNPKPDLLSHLKETSRYIYKNGKLHFVSQTGEHPEDTRVYRNAGRYKIYLQSFKCALPYTNVIVADTQTGKVYMCSETQGMGTFKQDIEELQEYFMDGNEI